MITALLSVLMIQDKPDEIFAAVEKRLAAAKTVRLKAKIEGTRKGAADKGEFSADVKLKTGNLAWLDLTGVEAGKTRAFRFICDGKRRFTDGGRGMAQRDDAAEGTEARFRAVVLRAGAIFLPMMSDGARIVAKLDDILAVADFKLADDRKIGDRRVRVIEFTLTSDVGRSMKIATRLFVDAETLLPLKREASDESVTVVETYEFTLDADLADKDFELPAEK